MAKYIEREAAMKDIDQYSAFRCQLGGLMDVVEFLKDQPAADVVPAPAWISVKDRLPDGMEDVLVVAFWHERYQAMIGYCLARATGSWRVFTSNGEVIPGPVTHWMPLPEPPKEVLNEPSI